MDKKQREEIVKLLESLTGNSYDKAFKNGILTVLDILDIKLEDED